MTEDVVRMLGRHPSDWTDAALESLVVSVAAFHGLDDTEEAHMRGVLVAARALYATDCDQAAALVADVQTACRMHTGRIRADALFAALRRALELSR